MSFFIGCTASLLSIAMLAVERSIAVNARYHRKLSKKRAVNISIAIWIFSLAFPCIYFQIGYFKFAFIFAILMIIVTFVTMVKAFIRIHGNMRTASKRTIKVQPTGSVNEETSQIQQKRAERERRVTRIFTAIFIFYAACNLPAFVFIFIINLCSTCSCIFIHWSRDLLLLCVLINCSGNQFLYAWRMKSFTRAFRSLVRLPLNDEASVIQTTNATNIGAGVAQLVSALAFKLELRDSILRISTSVLTLKTEHCKYNGGQTLTTICCQI